MDVPQISPALSTPDTHIFKASSDIPSDQSSLRLSDRAFQISYEIERTIADIRRARYARVALQFPDSMLPDGPRVFEALSKGLDSVSRKPITNVDRTEDHGHSNQGLIDSDIVHDERPAVRLYILADTSYGACCVDEIAAEHVNADAVVHYGRACLSPTARIPVIHVFTRQPIWNQDELIQVLRDTYPDKTQKVIVMADVTCQNHLEALTASCRDFGFCKQIHITDVVHDPSSHLPNRTVPEEVRADPPRLTEWNLFHVSHPPESLLLTLASRVANVRIFIPSNNEHGKPSEPFLASTSRALNRRYALLTSVATVSIFGILINTLSVKNYLHIVERVKAQILAAGKKSYTFVVGKVNAAKVANFSEVGAWVVIGCWESSLIDSKDFWRPVLTPFELELALKSDNERVWTGKWTSDFQAILDTPVRPTEDITQMNERAPQSETESLEDEESESAPPAFDLRTGRYVSNSRPMQSSISAPGEHTTGKTAASRSLIRQSYRDLAVVGGEVSPGAEHLRSKRTWQGLGSDFEIAYEEAGGSVEQGRSGTARGYSVGQHNVKT